MLASYTSYQAVGDRVRLAIRVCFSSTLQSLALQLAYVNDPLDRISFYGREVFSSLTS